MPRISDIVHLMPRCFLNVPVFDRQPLSPCRAEADEPASEEETLSGMQRGLRFVCRVARASLPFQALLLLVLGAAALAPHARTECRGGLDPVLPVLRYPHGPPPL